MPLEKPVSESDQSWLPKIMTVAPKLTRLSLTGALLLAVAASAAFVSHEAASRHLSKASRRPPFRPGKEVLIVLVGSSTCAFSDSPGVRSAFATIVDSVRVQATRQGAATVSVVGVSVDWSLQQGLQYLNGIWPFDEVVVGRGWLGTGADRYVRQRAAPLAVPQLIVIERNVTLEGANGIRVDGEHPLVSLMGAERILQWASHGAPLPPASELSP